MVADRPLVPRPDEGYGLRADMAGRIAFNLGAALAGPNIGGVGWGPVGQHGRRIGDLAAGGKVSAALDDIVDLRHDIVGHGALIGGITSQDIDVNTVVSGAHCTQYTQGITGRSRGHRLGELILGNEHGPTLRRQYRCLSGGRLGVGPNPSHQGDAQDGESNERLCHGVFPYWPLDQDLGWRVSF
jgi:hypothetical protein